MGRQTAGAVHVPQKSSAEDSSCTSVPVGLECRPSRPSAAADEDEAGERERPRNGPRANAKLHRVVGGGADHVKPVGTAWIQLGRVEVQEGWSGVRDESRTAGLDRENVVSDEAQAARDELRRQGGLAAAGGSREGDGAASYLDGTRVQEVEAVRSRRQRHDLGKEEPLPLIPRDVRKMRLDRGSVRRDEVLAESRGRDSEAPGRVALDRHESRSAGTT